METQSSRILVAEDNKIFAKALCFNLEHFGYSTTVAFDGSEALRLAQQDQFDLVITDYQMPKILGMELCRRLRQDDRYAHTPMILMSAFEDRKVVELFDDLELLEAIFVKPFSMGELVSRIQECLTDCPDTTVSSP
ncbi:MAG: response regulator transcription factor [Pirellulaceae bacterium]|nr:response regulator transcription factor [Pirellulaceae bacterium]